MNNSDVWPWAFVFDQLLVLTRERSVRWVCSEGYPPGRESRCLLISKEPHLMVLIERNKQDEDALAEYSVYIFNGVNYNPYLWKEGGQLHELWQAIEQVEKEQGVAPSETAEYATLALMECILGNMRKWPTREVREKAMEKLNKLESQSVTSHLFFQGMYGLFSINVPLPKKVLDKEDGSIFCIWEKGDRVLAVQFMEASIKYSTYQKIRYGNLSPGTSGEFFSMNDCLKRGIALARWLVLGAPLPE